MSGFFGNFGFFRFAAPDPILGIVHRNDTFLSWEADLRDATWEWPLR